jgi:hypothetical protein
MQQTTEPNPTAATFASLLAALAAPASKSEPEWDDDDPAEELSTLSYESALRAHARYRPSPAPVGMLPINAPASAWSAETQAPQPAARVQTPLRAPEPLPQGKLRTASITIRMSEAEGDQLRHRAAEAGMTISAYLRSCTFEAESLRAQVKEAMAELRAATLAATLSAAPVPVASPDSLPAPRRNWRNMVERLMPHSQQFQHAARA